MFPHKNTRGIANFKNRRIPVYAVSRVICYLSRCYCMDSQKQHGDTLHCLVSAGTFMGVDGTDQVSPCLNIASKLFV
jgi:hypothetical protein